MSNKKFSGNISSKGYYIALILCAVAIGISGYLYYRNTNTTTDQNLEQAASVENIQQEDVQAVATQPDASKPTENVQETTQPTQPKAMKTVSPVAGQTVSAYAVDCLTYNQTTRDWRTHDGVDIAAEAGTEVCAAADGEVYSVYEDDTMGMTVVIVHDNGYATRYCSLDAEVAVTPGQLVTAGQTIGYVGNSALMETAVGDHVHFSISCNGESVDPAEFLS